MASSDARGLFAGTAVGDEEAEARLCESGEEGLTDPDRRLPLLDAVRAGAEESLRPTTGESLGPMLRKTSEDKQVCREFFGGGGRLTSAWRARGLAVLPPVETFPGGGAVPGRPRPAEALGGSERDLESEEGLVFTRAHDAPDGDIRGSCAFGEGGEDEGGPGRS